MNDYLKGYKRKDKDIETKELEQVSKLPEDLKVFKSYKEFMDKLAEDFNSNDTFNSNDIFFKLKNDLDDSSDINLKTFDNTVYVYNGDTPLFGFNEEFTYTDKENIKQTTLKNEILVAMLNKFFNKLNLVKLEKEVETYAANDKTGADLYDLNNQVNTGIEIITDKNDITKLIEEIEELDKTYKQGRKISTKKGDKVDEWNKEIAIIILTSEFEEFKRIKKNFKKFKDKRNANDIQQEGNTLSRIKKNYENMYTELSEGNAENLTMFPNENINARNISSEDRAKIYEISKNILSETIKTNNEIAKTSITNLDENVLEDYMKYLINITNGIDPKTTLTYDRKDVTALKNTMKENNFKNLGEFQKALEQNNWDVEKTLSRNTESAETRYEYTSSNNNSEISIDQVEEQKRLEKEKKEAVDPRNFKTASAYVDNYIEKTDIVDRKGKNLLHGATKIANLAVAGAAIRKMVKGGRGLVFGKAEDRKKHRKELGIGVGLGAGYLALNHVNATGLMATAKEWVSGFTEHDEIPNNMSKYVESAKIYTIFEGCSLKEMATAGVIDTGVEVKGIGGNIKGIDYDKAKIYLEGLKTSGEISDTELEKRTQALAELENRDDSGETDVKDILTDELKIDKEDLKGSETISTKFKEYVNNQGNIAEALQKKMGARSEQLNDGSTFNTPDKAKLQNIAQEMRYDGMKDVDFNVDGTSLYIGQNISVDRTEKIKLTKDNDKYSIEFGGKSYEAKDLKSAMYLGYKASELLREKGKGTDTFTMDNGKFKLGNKEYSDNDLKSYAPELLATSNGEAKRTEYLELLNNASS